MRESTILQQLNDERQGILRLLSLPNFENKFFDLFFIYVFLYMIKPATVKKF